MTRNYIPRNDAAFDKFFKYITQYVSLKSSGSRPEWGHIPQLDRTALDDTYATWYDAYSLTFQPHIKSVGDEKNRQRKDAEKALRHFVNRFLRYEPVTDADRTNMGIPNHDTVRSSHTVVHQTAAFEIDPEKACVLRAKIRVRGAENTAKPRGYHGVDIRYDVLDSRPASIHDLRQSDFSTRPIHRFYFNEEDRGKRAYFAMRWQNGSGVRGQWSEIVSAIVP
ncbi:MAG: hypothetical protein FWB99_00615 [Treponema sp.]|nr:hypothetical protein [Treponema sp.]